MQNNACASTTVYPSWSPLRVKKDKQNLKRKRETSHKRQHAASRCVFAFVLIVTIQRRLRDQHGEHTTRRVAPSRAERSALAVSHRTGGRCNKSPYRSASEARAIKKGKI